MGGTRAALHSPGLPLADSFTGGYGGSFTGGYGGSFTGGYGGSFTGGYGGSGVKELEVIAPALRRGEMPVVTPLSQQRWVDGVGGGSVCGGGGDGGMYGTCPWMH